MSLSWQQDKKWMYPLSPVQECVLEGGGIGFVKKAEPKARLTLKVRICKESRAEGKAHLERGASAE